MIIYTDGACSGNPGPAGCGIVIFRDSKTYKYGYYIGSATNNIAELIAIREALLLSKEHKNLDIQLYTDSTYCIGVLSKNWKAKINCDLISEIKEIISEFSNLKLYHIKGHSGDPGNELANKLATDAVRSKKDHFSSNDF